MEIDAKSAFAILAAVIATALAFLLAPYLEQLQELGYAGAFIIALVANASVLLPAPGWAIIIAMGRVLDPVPLALAAGLGSGLGELSGYALGHGGSGALGAERLKQFREQKEWVKKYDAAAIFVLAALPNPLFDLAGIAAGAIRMPLWRFLFPCVLGKVVKTFILAQLGLLSLWVF